MEIKRIFVAGAGLMGGGITQVCAQAGYEVTMRDMTEAILDKSLKAIQWSVGKLVEKGRVQGTAAEIMARIKTTTDTSEAGDADFVFDARCLPNPHWQAGLRNLTGLDSEVAEYLEQEGVAREYYRQLETFLVNWVPRFKEDNRSYLSVAIGCTGGQHRSVYLVERLTQHLDGRLCDIVTRHRELE